LLSAGDTVPDFELPDETGTPRRLSTLLQDGPVALFWYPVASSGGCTAEACHFRDLASEFAAAGGQRVGISTDPVQAQAAFVQGSGLDYPLLSDADGAVAEQFGVRRKWLKAAPVKRATFVIGTDRRVLAAFKSETSMTAHADRALEALREHAA
jgi:peroxiredoxin Q/BCP